MTWKKVSNSDPGDADHFGGDDGDKISDLFSAVDVDDVDINSDWTFRDNKLKLRNPANTFSYTIRTNAIGADRDIYLPTITGVDEFSTLGLAQTFTAAKTFNNSTLKLRNPGDTFSYTVVPAAIAADRILNLPLITGTDTLATLGISNTFTEKQKISKATTPELLELHNDSNSVGDESQLSFELDDSAGNQTQYGAIETEIISNTDGAESGRMDLQLRDAGSITSRLRINNTGLTEIFGASGTTDLFRIDRDSGTNGDAVGMLFRMNDSGGNNTDYGRIRTEIVDNTDGSEDGKIVFATATAGSLTTCGEFNELGQLKIGSNRRVILSESGLTAGRTFTFPDISTGGGGGTPRVKIQSHQYYEIEDEFMAGSISATNTSNAIGVLNWGLSATGTAAPTYTGAGLSHPGVVNLVTGAATNDNVRLHLGPTATSNFMNVGDMERIAFIVRIPTITSIIVRIGLGQDLNGTDNGTAGAFFKFDPSVNAAWQTITRLASTNTTNTSGVTVTANNWYLLEIVQNSSSSWDFYINESLAFNHTTNIPTGSNAFGVCVQTTTTAARTLDLDYFKVRTETFGQRWT